MPSQKELDYIIELYEAAPPWDYEAVKSFIEKHPHRAELEQHLNDYLEHQEKGYLESTDSHAIQFMEEVKNDFPEEHELADYISTLENYCFEKLGADNRKQAYHAATFANNKKSGPTKKTYIVDEVKRLRSEGKSLKKALKIIGVSKSAYKTQKNKGSN